MYLDLAEPGTHWVWEVMMMLLRGQAETITFKKSLHMIEFNSAANISEFQSPRVLNSHVLYADLPHEVHTRRLKIVFVCRNPKDVAVSLYNHHVKLSEYYEYSGEFKDWLELFVEGKGVSPISSFICFLYTCGGSLGLSLYRSTSLSLFP